MRSHVFGGWLDYRMAKRTMDVVASLLLLAVLMPLFLLIAAVIKLSDGGPVFYTQKRVGLRGAEFDLYKFRSMTHVERRTHVQVYNDSEGVTAVGKYLRRLKLDETPQLYNVLRGDLSLVGPRPCLPETLEEFGRDAMTRHSVRPGLTGLAQVNGNVLLSWRERLTFDLEYVRNCSFLLDFRIIAKTAAVIVLGEAWGKQEQ
jgi:lipopolysaccharide/colanic/teichoic acid biosynthesis glycosyltransferase